MKYILVVGLTLLLSWSIIKISNKKGIKDLKKIVYSQSTMHELIKNFIPKEMFDKPDVITQSKKHSQKNMLKVIILENKAYWVLENVFYVADTIHGRINSDTIKPLDIENMSKKDLEKMLDILDSLRNGGGPDDSGSARN